MKHTSATQFGIAAVTRPAPTRNAPREESSAAPAFPRDPAITIDVAEHSLMRIVGARPHPRAHVGRFEEKALRRDFIEGLRRKANLFDFQFTAMPRAGI